MLDIVIRPAGQADLEVLWDFLAIAAYEPDARAAQSSPTVAAYLIEWMRLADFGFIADQYSKVVGAAWARQFLLNEGKIVHCDPHTPKISVAVAAHARGRG